MLLRNFQVRLVTGRRFFIVATTVFVLASVVTLWAYAKVRRFDSLPNPSAADARAANQQQNQNKRAVGPAPSSITVDTVTLTALGFEPREINRPSGKFVLGVDTRILSEEFSFELLRENGHRVRQFKMPKGQIRLRKLLNLPAGSYVLKMADHPEWTCSIVLSD